MTGYGFRRFLTLTSGSLLALGGLAALSGCNNDQEDAPKLSKGFETSVPEVPVPPADGPKLGALHYITKVMDRPSKQGEVLGHLRAGALVPRAEKPFAKTDDCDAGWYPINPRGFVCAADAATTDLEHPTLIAMAQQPKLDEALPYAYARTTQTTPIYERDPANDQAVQEVGKIRGRSGLAIVGSWSASDPEGKQQRLGMMTDGRFVRAADLQKAEFTDFKGVDLTQASLPVAFVVKRGVRAWQVEEGDVEKQGELNYHQIIPLTGKYREVNGLRYWATEDNRYVRHRDVTVVRRRENLPEFAQGETRWIDISIVTGTMTLYEGKKPVYVSLVSVGRNRLDDEGEAVTKRGTFKVTGKYITATQLDPKQVAQYWDVYDTPWVLELESGQRIHAAFWHSRFGIENTGGDIHLSPNDALHLFKWVNHQIPSGWNSAVNWPASDEPVRVEIRK